jgi:hypothetical protein
MARRKRPFIDDEDPDSTSGSEDDELSDGENERVKRKRRKGMLDDDEDEDEEVRRRTDWTRWVIRTFTECVCVCLFFGLCAELRDLLPERRSIIYRGMWKCKRLWKTKWKT